LFLVRKDHNSTKATKLICMHKFYYSTRFRIDPYFTCLIINDSFILKLFYETDLISSSGN
ncbi:MAG: hypothetical protein ABI850_19035, partial [Flavobacterium sp.]